MERLDHELWKGKEVARLLALVETERRYYQEMLASLPVALVVLAADRSVVSANRAFRQMFALSAEDLRRKSIEQIVPAERLIEKIRDVTVNGIPQPGFLLPLEQKLLRISILPVRSWADEAEMETLLTLADVSGVQAGATTDAGVPVERRRLVAERNLALRGLSARLAHDLNNPLMIITGYTEEMLHGLKADDPRRADAEQILEATGRIGRVTAQLLEFTRSQARPAEPVELAGVISGLRERIAAGAGEGIAVNLNVAGPPVWASANRGQLEEILLALASHEREGAQGRTHIAITCDTAGPYARIAIQDDGRGMDAAKSLAAFESIPSGLARAYGVVREWGGDIALESEPSRGSTFVVYLALISAQSAAPRPAAAPAPTATAREALRETILVVDDEPGIRALVAKILRRERYLVLEAGSASEAVTAAVTHGAHIHLLLTDVMLPDRSGREVAGQLHEAVHGLKVVYMSGFTDDDSLRTGDFPPGSRFLQKPFTLGALVGTVREALDQ